MARPQLQQRWHRPGGALLALALAASAACGGDGESAPSTSVPVAPAEAAAPQEQAPAAQAAPSETDPALEPFLLRGSPVVPPRFREVAREDREPILTLGLVTGAARVVYSSPTTGELLAVDLLRLEEGVDAEAFFTAFAAVLADDPEFQGVHTVGVVRGIGESARRYAFTVGGDDADAAAILRRGIVALITYRRPADFRGALNVDDVLRAVDAELQTPAEEPG